jgi:hypothetical protein
MEIKKLSSILKSYDLFHISCVPIEATQILSQAFPDEVANKGVIRGDNVE